MKTGFVFYAFFLVVRLNQGIALPLYSSPAFEDDSSSLSTKGAFINELSIYIRQEFGLKTGADFYTTFQKEDKPSFFVYCSSADSVCSPYNIFSAFGTDETAAIQYLKELESEGYHTMLYRTAGTSAAKLNSLLLSYRIETISFILFHEAMHRHLTKRLIPYEIVEAVCDVMGNYGVLAASENIGSIKKETVEQQLEINEKIYSVINKYDHALRPVREKKLRDSLFLRCEEEIGSLLKQGDAFQNDRFNYKINNAYFVRCRNYAKNYFSLKEIYLKLGNAASFLDFIFALPSDSAIETIGKKISELNQRYLPFDLVVTAKDDNGFPLNPKWGYQERYGSDSLPGLLKLGISRNHNEWTKGENPCTRDSIYVDPHKPPGCGLGHVNWFPVTYECSVSWKDHAFDDDYNFFLKREDKALYTHDNAGWIYAEFDSDETVDLWKKKNNDWWNDFHRAVDSSEFTAGNAFNGKPAIVCGLLGLDCSHSGETELHPVYMMAIHLKEDETDDTWAFFLRNWGNEGWCGTSQHYLQVQELKLRLPKEGAKELMYNSKTRIHSSMGNYSFSTEVDPGNGAVLTFKLPPPEQHGWVEGELHIDWQSENTAHPYPIQANTAIGEKLNAAISLKNQPSQKINTVPKIRLGKGKILGLFKRVW